jgi:hypothetical protein
MSGARIFRPNRLFDFQLGGFLVAQFLCGKIVPRTAKESGQHRTCRRRSIFAKIAITRATEALGIFFLRKAEGPLWVESRNSNGDIAKAPHDSGLVNPHRRTTSCLATDIRQIFWGAGGCPPVW